MKVEIASRGSSKFSDIRDGETFIFAGHDYIKARGQGSGFSRDYTVTDNVVRVHDGQLGSFKEDTVVVATPKSRFIREYA